MIVIAYAFGYLMMGAILLGVMTKIYYSSQKAKDFFDYIQLDIATSSGEAYVGYCFVFALMWPFLVVMSLLVFPFAYIKFMSDKRWRKNKDEKKKP